MFYDVCLQQDVVLYKGQMNRKDLCTIVGLCSKIVFRVSWAWWHILVMLCRATYGASIIAP